MSFRHYSRWEDAMIAQSRLYAWHNTPQGRDYLGFFEADIQAQHAPEDRMPTGALAAITQLTLRDADPIYVSSDVTDMIDIARETFEPEPVRINDPFVQQGFMLFPRPILIPDSDEYGDDAVVPVRAIAWMPVIDPADPERGCFWISLYTHADDDREFRTHWRDISVEEDTAAMRRIAPLSLAHLFQWSFGTAPWREGLNVAATGSQESANLRGRAQVTLPQVAWRIGQQFLRGPQRAPRQIRKDAQRKGLSHKEDITILTLRRAREAKEHEEETGRKLTVRHLVRGHWHTYITREGPRQMWITPYVRGADDLPFRATRRAVEFIR